LSAAELFRHTDDRREATASRAAGAGLDGFFVAAAGLAQMDVHVNETRHDELAGSVKDFGVVR
jgi:hypothetical protein